MLSSLSEFMSSVSATMVPRGWLVQSSLCYSVATAGQAWTLSDSLKLSTNML